MADRRHVFATVVTIATVIGSGYFMVAGLADPSALLPGADTAAARTLGAYMAARSAVLLGGAVWFLAIRSWTRLGLLLALNGAVQVLDGVVGVARHRPVEAIGPFVFAVALFAAAEGLRRALYR